MRHFQIAALCLLIAGSPVAAANTSAPDVENVPVAGPVVRAPAGVAPAFVAATWSDAAVHLLDANLADISSFPAGINEPNGIATGGGLIFVGTFDTSEIVAFDASGTEQFRWSDPGLGNLQGLTMVGNELAVMDAGSAGSDLIRFYPPTGGTTIRSFSSGPDGSGVEGLTYDGTYLWALGNNNLYAMDPADGSIERTIPNAASGCAFTGTGIAVGGPDQLVLGCADGSWYRVSALDGSVQSSGNNGLNMYGLEAFGAYVPPLVQAIPTIDAWGAAALALLLAGYAFLQLRRRRSS